MSAKAQPTQPGGAKQWVTVQKPLAPTAKEPGGLKQRGKSQENSFLQTLSKDLILSFQKSSEGEEAASELGEVVRIEVSGYGVKILEEEAILSCVKLRICNLSECFVEDISPFYASVNLLKLDLSDNQVSQLPAESFWKSLLSLRVLYLNGNLIGDKESVVRLNSCPKLHILTLYNTPLSLLPHYRHHVVNSIFSLRALDQHVISDQEIIENLPVTDTFRALTSHFKLPLHFMLKPGSSVRDEERVVFRLLLAVDTVQAKHSPVVILQRWTRGYLCRRNAKKHPNHKIRELVSRHMKRALAREESLAAPSLLVTKPSSEATFSKRHHRQQPSQNFLPAPQVKRDTLPPPPPSSPRSPAHGHAPCGGGVRTVLETHVMGLDTTTSRLKFSMHVNLRRLQQNIEHIEKESEELSLPKAGLNKTHTVRSLVLATSPGGKRTLPLSSTGKQKDGGSSQEAKVSAKTRAEDTKCQIEEGIAVAKAREDNFSFLPQDILQARENQQDEEHIRVSGLPLAVLPHEAIPPLTETKRANSESIRQAKREIDRRMMKLRAAPPKISALTPKQDTMSKDDFVFTRVYGTMNLAVLRQVEGIHRARRLSQEQEERTNMVARVRRERISKRNKMVAYHAQLRERVQEWRCREEGWLERAKEHGDKQREAWLIQQYQKQEQANTVWQKQQEEREFSQHFKQNNTLISNTLATEDRRAAQDTTSASVKDRVRQVRRDSLEKQEEARRYLEQRRHRLLREGRESKEELDAKMLELASQQLMEGKKRIAKAMARSEAARAAVALMREEMKLHPQGPKEAMPATNMGPVVHMEGGPLSATASKGFGVSSEYKSPSHVTKMMSECHDTWQRGVKAIEMNRHLPVTSHAEGGTGAGLMGDDPVSPLMHGMMIPHLPPKSAPRPPDTPFTEFDSSTSSLCPSRNTIHI